MNLQELGSLVGSLLAVSVLIRYLLDKRDRNKRVKAALEQTEINKEINKLIEEVKSKEISVEKKRDNYEKIRDRVLDITKRSNPSK